MLCAGSSGGSLPPAARQDAQLHSLCRGGGAAERLVQVPGPAGPGVILVMPQVTLAVLLRSECGATRAASLEACWARCTQISMTRGFSHHRFSRFSAGCFRAAAPTESCGHRLFLHQASQSRVVRLILTRLQQLSRNALCAGDGCGIARGRGRGLAGGDAGQHHPAIASVSRFHGYIS